MTTGHTAKDPCEYTDVRAANEDVYDSLLQKLIAYNQTMVTPLDMLYPEDPEGANPAKHGGYWSPWR